MMPLPPGLMSEDPLDDVVLLRPTHPKLLVAHEQAAAIQALYQVLGRDSQVFMTTRSDQVLPLCLQNGPDLVLLHAAMPDATGDSGRSGSGGLDGMAVCHQLKADERTRHIPVIMLTAADDAREEVEALKLGAADCLSQPLNPVLVKARVDTHLALHHQASLLREWLEQDPITGLSNRKRFDRQMLVEWRRAVRSGESLTLIRIGLDGMDEWRQMVGGPAADAALRDVATCLRDKLQRPADLVSCLDKDQFGCLLPDTPWPQALTLARDLQQHLRDVVLERLDRPRVGHVLASMGVVVRSRDSLGNLPSWLALAEARLKDAQRMGGDHVHGMLMP